MRRLLLGNLLIVLGAIVLALGIGTVAYADWAERQHAAQAPAVPRETLPSRVDTSARAQTLATATLAATPWPTAALPPPTLPPTPSRPTLEPTYTVSAPTTEPAPPVVASEEPPVVSAETPPVVALEEPSVVAMAPTATPTPPPSYGPAVSMAIPKLKLTENVMEVGVAWGSYVVPSWDIGHHEDSAQPGEPGNAVFNGHIETINAGHVFSRLKELVPGDAIYTYTKSERLTWVVRETKKVDHNATDFVAPTDDTRITLYTCAGTWLPLEHDYSERLVVVGELANVEPRG
jgi:sortase A